MFHHKGGASVKRIVILFLVATVLLVPLSSFEVYASYVEPDKETGGSIDITLTYTGQFLQSGSNVSLPFESVVTKYSTYTNTLNYFYNTFNATQLFKTEKDVYAYKIAVYRNSFSSGNWVNIDSLKLAVGTKNQMSNGTANINSGIASDQESIYWLVTDYSDGEKIFASLFVKAHELISAYEEGVNQSIVYPYLDVRAGFGVSWAKYSFVDYVQALYDDMQDLILLVQSGNTLSETQISRLSAIIEQLQDLNHEADKQTVQFQQIIALLTENFKLLHQELDQEIQLLQNIRNLLEQSAKEDSDAVADWQESTSEKNEQIDSAVNESNKLEKPNADDVVESVNSNIDGVAIRDYGILLSTFTTHPKILNMIMIALSVGLCAYVLFGKR